MTCDICNTKFYGQTMSSPAEPCDCGSCAKAYNEEEWQALQEARTSWKAHQAHERTDDPQCPWCHPELRDE
jgi:hypothetical protein